MKSTLYFSDGENSPRTISAGGKMPNNCRVLTVALVITLLAVQAAPAGAQTTPVQPVFSPYGTALWEATGTSTPNKLTMAMSVSESDGLFGTLPQRRSRIARDPVLISALIGAGTGFLATTIMFHAGGEDPAFAAYAGLMLGAPIGAAVGAVVGLIKTR